MRANISRTLAARWPKPFAPYVLTEDFFSREHQLRIHCRIYVHYSIFSHLGYLAKVPEGLKPDERKWFEHRHLSQAAPYILRRGKALVAPELPEVIEQVVYCEMGQAQRGLYNAVHQQTERDLLDLAGGARAARPNAHGRICPNSQAPADLCRTSTCG